MNTININGRTYNVKGNCVSIQNNKVFVDGEDITPDEKDIKISIEGSIKELSVDACSKVVVHGNCGSINAKSGDIEINGDVNGSVKSMSGDIRCKKVSGHISTMSGDVICK